MYCTLYFRFHCSIRGGNKVKSWLVMSRIYIGKAGKQSFFYLVTAIRCTLYSTLLLRAILVPIQQTLLRKYPILSNVSYSI